MITRELEKQLIETAADLYFLDVDSIADMDKMGKKSAQNLLSALENSKKNPLYRLVHAFGIRHIGEKAAKILAKKFGLGIGISSGANLLASIITANNNDNVVTIFPDDSKKYLSTDLTKNINNDQELISNQIEIISEIFLYFVFKNKKQFNGTNE